MKVALTGATGFVGSHILSELQEHGHEVTALVRGPDQVEVIRSRGGRPVVIDLYERPLVLHLLRGADATIHTASGGDPDDQYLDEAVAEAAIEAVAGTGKPYIGISGLWIYGDNVAITEESPIKPPAFMAWKEAIERRILEARGMRGILIVSSVAYGDGGGGIPQLLLSSPRDPEGNLVMVGSGQQHWSTVHVVDLARAFRHVLEDGSARGRYIVGDGRNPTVAELTEAAAVATGAPGATAGSDEAARARLGDALAEALLLDQATAAAKARDRLGWNPTHPGFVDELRDSYRKLAAT